MIQHNFIYGRPVRSNEFLNRENELRTILHRVRNSESTAIVGPPRVGKSSLLVKLADKSTQRTHLADSADSLVTVLMDLHPINSPQEFWEEALDIFEGDNNNQLLKQHLQQANQSGFTSRHLQRIFRNLFQNNLILVLLLDEFERLLIHPKFQDPGFFASLRSLSTGTGGLVIVTASRLSVSEMNEHGRTLLDAGSPFFNHMIEVKLRPFDKETVTKLLGKLGTELSIHNQQFIRRVAGQHPFLLQAMAASFAETAGSDQLEQTAKVFYSRVSYHFDEVWLTLDDRNRTTLVILALVELGQRVLGWGFANSEIESVDVMGSELRRLADRGLAEQINDEWEFDRQHLLTWRGESWTTSAQAFTWWVRDMVLFGTNAVHSFSDWLVNNPFRHILTDEQWHWLVDALRNASEQVLDDVTDFAKILFDELVE